MRTQSRWALAVATILAMGNFLWATDPSPTTITIPDMHCGGCAKKVAASLVEVPGVAMAQPNMETRTVTVIPKAQTTMSPRMLWEAVEKAKKAPSKLVGPNGTFTVKPQS